MRKTALKVALVCTYISYAQDQIVNGDLTVNGTIKTEVNRYTPNYPSLTSRGDVLHIYENINNGIEIGIGGGSNTRRSWILSRHSDVSNYGKYYSTLHLQPSTGNVSKYRGIAIGYNAGEHVQYGTHLAVNGNVGFGTTSPFTNLQIHSSNADSRIALTNSASGSNSSDGFVLINESDNNVHFLNRENASLKFSTNGSEKMRLEANGNMGIGVASPTELLTLKPNASLGWEYTSGNGSYHTISGGGINPMSFTVNPFSANSPVFEFNGFSSNILTMLNGGNVGIGVVEPTTRLEVAGTISARNELRSISSNPALLLNETDVTDKNWHLQVNGGDFKFFEVDDARSSWSNKMTIHSGSGNVGIGTSDTGSHKLAVEGSIGAREIKVEASGWSDFVFDTSYDLPTLKEVKAHILQKGHLKDIPSAAEVEKNGFFLGAMDAKLLQKIEELTLYTIQQEERLDKLANENKQLWQENELLKQISAKLILLEKKLESIEIESK